MIQPGVYESKLFQDNRRIIVLEPSRGGVKPDIIHVTNEGRSIRMVDEEIHKWAEEFVRLGHWVPYKPKL